MNQPHENVLNGVGSSSRWSGRRDNLVHLIVKRLEVLTMAQRIVLVCELAVEPVGGCALAEADGQDNLRTLVEEAEDIVSHRVKGLLESTECWLPPDKAHQAHVRL